MPHLQPSAVAALAALLTGAAGGCLENIPRPAATTASITVEPDSAAIMEGDTLTLKATARNASHLVLPDAHLGWASSDLSVVSVDPSGLIHGVRPGIATVVATADGVSGRAVVTVSARVAGLRITPAELTLVPGGSFTFVADAVGSDGSVLGRRAPAWSSSDTAVVRAGAGGLATGVREGTAWLLARDGALTDSVPVRVTTVRFTSLSAGPYQNTCAAGPQGAFCWGYEGNAGNLGTGAFVNELAAPVAVSGGSRFAVVGAGDAYSCGLTADGAASCWGNGAFGRLGDGTGEPTRATPRPVAGSLTFRSLTTGRRHACGLSPTGQAWCWGGNATGALGIPTTTGQSSSPVAAITEQRFTVLAAGNLHTCGLAADGTAWCWGRGIQLGDSVGLTRATPAPVAGGHVFIALSVGYNHSCGVDADSLTWCWGSNLAGELGRAGDTVETAPAQVLAAPGFARVTAGYFATCGLTADGTAWCWGWNNAGQLGTGDTVGGPTPRPVAGGLRFTALSIGYAHGCGLATDGLLYCWGAALHGMLGDGTVTGERLTPWPVLGQAAPVPSSRPAPAAAPRRSAVPPRAGGRRP